MKVSELIKELEDFLENIGDLEVVKTGEYLGSDSVDGIAFIRAHECLIANDYLDNYTQTTEQKLNKVKEDLSEILKDVSCKDCRWCNETDVGNRCWEREIDLQNSEVTDDKLICFTPNDDVEIDRYILVKMQYCGAKLQKDLLEEEYLKEVQKWK